MRWLLLTVLLVPVWAEGPVFSHKRHANVNLACTFCHKSAARAERAGFPAWKTCATCHPDKREETIPSQRVYRLPDFVFFSHVRHVAAKTECSVCHGDVKTQEKIELAQPLKMAVCVDCHKANKATVACTACHELGQ
ncbi:MAG TPA: cytochrome c3 family protein [Bryobacteraceae bacterium]|nr:cytochrome c3 family protein [Bryobacteraceae bacterium]